LKVRLLAPGINPVHIYQLSRHTETIGDQRHCGIFATSWAATKSQKNAASSSLCMIEIECRVISRWITAEPSMVTAASAGMADIGRSGIYPLKTGKNPWMVMVLMRIVRIFLASRIADLFSENIPPGPRPISPALLIPPNKKTNTQRFIPHT
jgi:hypothetical protein